MASTYSPLLRIELIGTGDQSGTWGITTNTNLGTLIEQAIAGTATFSVTAGDVTLTDLDGATDQARCMALRITGTPGTTRNIIAPFNSGTPLFEPASKFYIIANGSNAAVVIKTALPAISNGSFVVGCQYAIASLGSTTNAEWNTIAGTSGVTYSVGSTFTATVAGTGTGNGTATPAGVTVPSGEVYLVYFDTTFMNFRLVGRSASSANTPNTLVLRDASGNFSAGNITVGNVTSSGTVTATTVTATTLQGGYTGALGSGATALTPSTGDNTPRVANTAFVQNSTSLLVGPLNGGDSGLITVSGIFNTVTISQASPAVVTLSATVTTQICEFASATTTVTLRASNSLIRAGQRVSGTNIPSGTTVSTISTASVTAGSFITGVQYTITSVGTTDFTLIGAANNNIGTTFTATGVGTGTGTAYSFIITLSQATSGAGTNTTLTFSNMPSNNDRVIFRTTGTLPAGLSLNTPYFVINSGTTTFNVSLTLGGAAINTTSAGSGTHSFGRLATTGALEIAGTLNVINGGTGANSLRLNNLLVGNDTSTPKVIPAGAGGNVLTSTTLTTVTAGSFVVGTQYTIASVGTTNFVAIGAASSTVGVVFIATGVGSGTGTATTNEWQSSALNVIGQAQTWQDVTGSRVKGTSYQNTTGRPIMVALSMSDTTGGSGMAQSNIQVSTDNTTWITIGVMGCQSQDDINRATFSFIVPNGLYYRATNANKSPTISPWAELR